MSRMVCGVHRCPRTFPAGPNRLYCDVHAELNEDLEGDYEDWMRGTLESFMWGAESFLALTTESATTRFGRYAATEILRYVPVVLEAIEAGKPWTALHHAAWAGKMWGFLEGESDRLQITRLKPMADYGIKTKMDRSGGGQMTRRAPPDPLLEDEVRTMHRKWPNLSWSAVCERVGLKHGISRQTVQKYAKKADWRSSQRNSSGATD